MPDADRGAAAHAGGGRIAERLALARVSDARERAPRIGASDSVGASVPAEIRSKFQTFVYDVVNAAQGGYTLESLKLEDAAAPGHRFG